MQGSARLSIAAAELGLRCSPLKLQRLYLGGEAVHHQHHLPGTEPAPGQPMEAITTGSQTDAQRRTRPSALRSGKAIEWHRLCMPHSITQMATTSGYGNVRGTYPLVLDAPFTSSPLCWRMRRRGLTVKPT